MKTMRFVTDTQTVPRDAKSPGLQVIAAGKWRCATSSLQVAFEQILQPPLAPSMHGAYILPSAPKRKMIHQAISERNRKKRQALLHQIFDGYNASSDWPGHVFLDDLLDMYPNCKVILNKRRSPEEWEKSVRSSLLFFSTWKYALLTYWIPFCYWHHKAYSDYARLAKERYGVDDFFTVECYERHNEWVRQVAAARGKEVLEWQPGDGWEPLCKFLDREVPQEVFPRTNETEEINGLKVALVRRGLMAWVGVLGVATLLVLGGVYLYK